MSTTRPKTKVIVRHLPPGMLEETWKTFLDGLAGGRYNWLSYYPGKISLKRVVFSRAYINFLTVDDVYDFKQRFDGHVFIGQKGHQYRCSVEYAPLQKVPAPEEKPHALEGTIEKDPDYLAFVEAMDAGQIQPDMSAATSGSATDMPYAGTAAAAASSEGITEGKVLESRLMQYLMRKYAEGGNRLGALRFASKAKQSKHDVVEQVQKQDSRPGGGGRTARTAAAAAAAATAALTAVAAVEDTGKERGGRRERERSTKGAVASAVVGTEAGSGSKATQARGTTAKAAQRAGSLAGEAEAAAVSLLVPGGKGVGKEAAGERRSGEARPQSGARAGSVKVQGTESGRIARGSAGRGQHEEQDASVVVRQTPSAAPQALLVKGGEARPTQLVPPVTAPPLKKQQQQGQPTKPPTQQQQQQTSTPSAGGSGSVGLAVMVDASGSTQPARSSTGDRRTSKIVSTTPTASTAVATRSTSSTASASTPSNNTTEGGLAATASAAAAAALAAAVARTTPAGKKVRAGFQMYVPGSLRARAGTGAAAASEEGGPAAGRSNGGGDTNG